MKTSLFEQHYFLSASECNPQQEMPLPLLMTRIIEMATLHANSWGVGYERLIADNQGWVLSRVTCEMQRYPQVNQNYSLSTWIEDYNRRFSLRNLEIKDENGIAIGYARTVWMVINYATRQGVDISKLDYMKSNVLAKPCPIEPQGRLHTVTTGLSVPYTFGYVDCDVNRHVNTVRYLEHLLNCFTMEKMDNHYVHRMELAFNQETRYGDHATIHLDNSDALDCHMSIDVDGTSHCKARFGFNPRR